MLAFRSFSAVAVLLSFGAVALGARPALAVPCCGSDMCQQDNPPWICNNCTPTCVDEEPSVEELIYDEVESICYVSDVAAPDAEQPAEREVAVDAK